MGVVGREGRIGVPSLAGFVVFLGLLSALVLAAGISPSGSEDGRPSGNVFGWFTILVDIYDPGKIAGVAVYIDNEQIEDETEARQLAERVVDHVFTAPGSVRPGFVVGVQYPLREELILEIKGGSPDPDLASGALGYQQFDHPDRITGSHGSQGSQAWADHGIFLPDDGWGDTGVMGNPLPDYNNAYATIRMSKDSFQVGSTGTYQVGLWADLDAVAHHWPESWAQYYYQWRVTGVAGMSESFDDCDIHGWWLMALWCDLQTGRSYEAVYNEGANSRGYQGQPAYSVANFYAIWDYMFVAPA